MCLRVVSGSISSSGSYIQLPPPPRELTRAERPGKVTITEPATRDK